MSKRYLVTVDDGLAAAIERERGEVPAIEWIRNRLRAAVSAGESKPVPASAPAPRQVSAPRVTAPVSKPVEQPAQSVNGKRSAALSAISSIPRRMVASQKPAPDDVDSVSYDRSDSQE